MGNGHSKGRNGEVCDTEKNLIVGLNSLKNKGIGRDGTPENPKFRLAKRWWIGHISGPVSAFCTVAAS